MGVIQIQAQEVDSVPVMESQFVEIDLPKELNGFDYKAKYSDKSYQEYIDNYQVNTKKKFLYKFTKRLFDIIFALVMLAILSPVMVISSLAIIIEMTFNKNSRGSIFFVQKRMGKGGKVFNCLKFRTMKRHCNHDCATVLVKDVKNQYTKVGSFLRRFSLDEIPQLFCVLIGSHFPLQTNPHTLSHPQTSTHLLSSDRPHIPHPDSKRIMLWHEDFHNKNL